MTLATSNSHVIVDITTDLPSLQFESALTEEEKNYVCLRKRSHALTASACAHTVYFTSIINEARLIITQLRNPDFKRASRLIDNSAPKDPLLIGIIGCGRLGCHIAQALLTFGEVSPGDLKISTRRPETLTELRAKDVLCVYNNTEVARSSHVLFICVLPSQFQMVADEIREFLPPCTVVYSMVATLSMSRLKQLLRTPNVVRPTYSWTEEHNSRAWNYDTEVVSTFEDARLVELTCPLSFNKNRAVVETNQHFAEAIIYSFVNFCSAKKLTITETVDVANAVLIGHTRKAQLPEVFSCTDLFPGVSTDEAESTLAPIQNVSQINSDVMSPLMDKLATSSALRGAFVRRYCHVFAQYIAWKNTALAQLRK